MAMFNGKEVKLYANMSGGGGVDSINGMVGDVVLTTNDLQNDSGFVTEEEIAGFVNTSSDAGTKENHRNAKLFLNEMNRLSISVGLENTDWRTVSGYPKNEVGGVLETKFCSRTTAYDLLKTLILARHTKIAYKAMSKGQIDYKISGEQKTATHSVIGASTYIAWAAEHAYTILAAKGGTLLGNFGSLGANGVYTMSMIVEDVTGVYAVAVVGMNCYEKGTPERTAEQALMRTIIHGLICEIKNIEIADETERANYNAAKNRTPVIGMAACKLTESGTFEEDIARMSGSNYVAHNENEVRGAASVTKIMMACVASRFFTSNHEITICASDLVGGSGVELSAGDRLNIVDALNVCMMVSDNQLATAIARDCGARMENGARTLWANSEIPNGADLNDYTEAGVYSVASNTIAESLENAPSGIAGVLIVEKLGGAMSTFWRQKYIPAVSSCTFYARYKTGTWHTFAPTE